jgi:hypothetical protein
MAFVGVVVFFPLLLAALSLGTGLGVERLTGVDLPPVLLIPLGFGGLVVISQFTEWRVPLAPLTPLILAAVALAGFVVSRRSLAARWRARPAGWFWIPLAGVAAYLTVAAPEIAALRLTFPGYLLDTTAGIQLQGAARLLEYGHNFTNGYPGYGATLVQYFGNGYPSGAHTVLGPVGWLSGENLLWVYSPYQAAELAFAALVLGFLALRAGLPRPLAALAGWIAAVPALVYAYALQGSVKELTLMPELMLMGGLVVLAPSLARGGWRAILPYAVVGAAALGAIGIAASPWVALFALALLAFAAPAIRARYRRWVAVPAAGVLLAAATAVLALPTVGPLSTTLALARNVSGSDQQALADPGNLLRPLLRVQALGVWLGPSHRIDPRHLTLTYALIGVVAVCFLLGLAWLIARRAWAVFATVAISVFTWWAVTQRGTTWTDAKLLVLLSPILLLVAMIGAVGRFDEHRFEAVVLAAAVVCGVLGSDVLLYRATNLAPTERFSELASIGQRFAGQGPTLATDFDEYGLYLLRKMELNEPGIAYHGSLTLAGGGGTGYGHTYDTDALSPFDVQLFRTIVTRVSPLASRPPGNYALVWSGEFYEVWRRDGPAPKLHVPFGGSQQPAAPAACKAVGAAAALARADGGGLVAAERPENAVANLADAVGSPNAIRSVDLEGLPFWLLGVARLSDTVTVTSPGSYTLWLGGDVDRPLHVYVDGRLIGSPAAQTGGDENVIRVADLTLGKGVHQVVLVRGGGGIGPGVDNGTAIDAVVLQPAAAASDRIVRLPASGWRSLCGQSLDWLEVD